MRGFLFGALILTGLDLVLTSRAANVAGAAALPAQWLAKWMSPAVPLITRPVPVTPAGTGGAGGLLDSGNPAATQTNPLGESKTGACPPGFPPGLKCAGM